MTKDKNYISQLVEPVLGLITGSSNEANQAVKSFLDAWKRSDLAKSNANCLGFSEGSEEHRALISACAKQLKRNLKAGERKRLAWLAASSYTQEQSIGDNITAKAKAKAYRGQWLGSSKAIKSVV